MNFFSIKFGSEKVDQQTIIERLKSDGYEVMQVSDGLVVKVGSATRAIPEALGPLAAKVDVEVLNINRAAQDSQFSRDARQFLGLGA